MGIATVNRLITLFDAAFRALSVQVSLEQNERLGVLVHQAMSSKTRVYHCAGHVFSLCEGMNPTQTLAALFHDVVYYQLDGGFPMGTGYLLDDVVQVNGTELHLKPMTDTDPALRMCAELFGFKSGQVLSLYDGMNEFLSAVLAARLLSPYLSASQLVAVIACIEATIAFRPATNGATAMEALAKRVRQQYVYLGEYANADQVDALVDATLKDAVLLANRDVGGFGQSDPGSFLSSTWLLIDESNAPLSNPGVYSVQDYRGALVRMAGFLGHLNASAIFQHYGTIPSAQVLEHQTEAARRNIAFARDFLRAKIISIAIIEALVLCTGSDCPVSMFLGDMRSDSGQPDQVQDFLPPAPAAHVLDSALLAVLQKGRSLQTNNDLTASPLTAFTYQFMGHQNTLDAMVHATAMFGGALSPQAFLETLDSNMVRAISHACAHIALSRARALRELTQWH